MRDGLGSIWFWPGKAGPLSDELALLLGFWIGGGGLLKEGGGCEKLKAGEAGLVTTGGGGLAKS